MYKYNLCPEVLACHDMKVKRGQIAQQFSTSSGNSYFVSAGYSGFDCPEEHLLSIDHGTSDSQILELAVMLKFKCGC